jgi:hypothetical protein
MTPYKETVAAPMTSEEIRHRRRVCAVLNWLRARAKEENNVPTLARAVNHAQWCFPLLEYAQHHLIGTDARQLAFQ